MGELFLRDILIVVAIAMPVVLIANKINLPTIVGFLLTGILIGPEGLRFIGDVGRIDTLAEVGVALLLFHIGLEFSAGNLKGLKRVIFESGLLQVFATVAASIGLSFVIAWPLKQGIFFGFAAALSSTAMTLTFLSYKRWLDSPAGRIATGILVLQDLAIVPMLILLPLLGNGEFQQVFSIASLYPLIKIILVFGALWLFYHFILGRLLHYIAHAGSKELFIMVLIGMALGSAWFTEKLGLSFALGAFLAGLMISTTPYRFHALSEIAPFRSLVSGLFFVAVGMLISPSFIITHFSQIIILVLFIVIFKTLITASSVFIFGYPIGVALIVGMLLGQMGEFSFLLVRVGYKEAIINREIYDLFIAASGVSLVIAPIIMEATGFVDKILGRISPRSLSSGKQKLNNGNREQLKDHAIICGFGPLGKTIGHLLEKSKIDYVVLELNPRTAIKLRKANRNVYIGDGASAELLSHSNIEKARLLAIAVPDYVNAIAIVRQARKLNSQITILTRSRYRDQVPDLYEAGADIVICEELEGGVEMGRYVLLELGIEEEDVLNFVQEVRSFGSADFF